MVWQAEERGREEGIVKVERKIGACMPVPSVVRLACQLAEVLMAAIGLHLGFVMPSRVRGAVYGARKGEGGAPSAPFMMLTVNSRSP